MGERLLSVGLDVGTTSTQLIVSALQIENRASTFSVPEMQITNRQILYKSPVHFTPLLQEELVDGEALRSLVEAEYRNAGITREMVDTGAVIITGETSRKENAAAVLANLSDLAGDFVVATAGPDLESILAAKGAGAVEYAAETGTNVLHMDIGGGTSNLCLIQQGHIVATGCLNVGGRLLKFDKKGAISYISPVLDGIFSKKVGQIPTISDLKDLANTLVCALEMAAGLRPSDHLLAQLQTTEATPLPSVPEGCVISFSGGVADCIRQDFPNLAFGDMGPRLGKAIRASRLCAGPYRLGKETIRATVVGAGCHSTQLSGSTVFYQNMTFPQKNLPVVTELSALSRLDGPGVLALPGATGGYRQIVQMAQKIATQWPAQPVLTALEADMAKALGHALALRLPKDRTILCIDRVKFSEGDYLDVGTPVSAAIPVVVKTLILNH